MTHGEVTGMSCWVVSYGSVSNALRLFLFYKGR
jgi:hypothetical protein